MGDVRPAPPAKLFVAALIAPDGLDRLDRFDGALTDDFGPIERVSPTWPFDLTGYYADQMGPGLVRRIVSFEEIFDPGELAAVKRRTNELEEQFAAEFRGVGGGRIINLDAGYLTLGQIVLATTKSYSHRIYLRDGIWAEVTLRFFKGRYEKWEWTYPDYADGRYNEFWYEVRERLKAQISEMKRT